MIKKSKGRYIISAGEVGIYAVCPHSWKLKSILKKNYKNSKNDNIKMGLALHKDWSKKTEDIHKLSIKMAIVLCLMFFSVSFTIIFLGDKFFPNNKVLNYIGYHKSSGSFFKNLLNDFKDSVYQIFDLDIDIFLFVILISLALFVVYFAGHYIKSRYDASGIKEKSTLLAIDGSKILKVKDYISYMQGISGKPDAVIKENSYFIPVEIKPLARKLKDRYIYQLLVYMRLIAEFKKKDVPYGYLILGPKSKRVKIHNLPERQKMLTKFLNDMNEILDKKKDAIASPTKTKCAKCDVSKYCQYKAC